MLVPQAAATVLPAVKAIMHPTKRNDDLPMFLTHQCAWCTVILDGPFAGLKPTNEQGVAFLIVGEYVSHGICEECCETVRASYQR